MEEAPTYSKEPSHSAQINGLNEWNDGFLWKYPHICNALKRNCILLHLTVCANTHGLPSFPCWKHKQPPSTNVLYHPLSFLWAAACWVLCSACTEQQSPTAFRYTITHIVPSLDHCNPPFWLLIYHSAT